MIEGTQMRLKLEMVLITQYEIPVTFAEVQN